MHTFAYGEKGHLLNAFNRIHAEVWCARSVIAKLILDGVKYYIPCDCQGSYILYGQVCINVESDGRAID